MVFVGLKKNTIYLNHFLNFWFKEKYYLFKSFLKFYDQFIFPHYEALELWILQYSKEISMLCNVKIV